MTLKVAVLQYNPKFGEKEKNLKRAIEMLSEQTFDLAVLPELFATGYHFTSKSEVVALSEEIPNRLTTKTLQRFCKEKKVFIAYGLAEKDGSRYYNSAVLLGPRGVVSHYRKLHLFYEEKKWFTPGNLPLSVHSILGTKAGLMICYDWRFPETARTLMLKGAELILHPSNLVMPHCPQAMITRSLENGVFSITADRTGTERRGGKALTYIGQSQVVDPSGNLLVRLSRTEETVAVVEIDPKKARDKSLNRHNHIIKDRRPDRYA